MINYSFNKDTSNINKYSIKPYRKFYEDLITNDDKEIGFKRFSDKVSTERDIDYALINAIEAVELFGLVLKEEDAKLFSSLGIMKIEDNISYCEKCKSAVAMYFNGSEDSDFTYKRVCKDCLYDLSTIDYNDFYNIIDNVLNNKQVSHEVKFLTSNMMMGCLTGYLLAPNGGFRIVYNDNNELVEDPRRLPIISTESTFLETTYLLNIVNSEVVEE